ncbi:membrane protein [Aminobacter sp. Y103A]|nr:membrane protein [Aminobacter sp. SS-2016]
MSFLVNLALGLLFGIGLVVSGMSDPAKVLNFLDVTGTWDPSLAFVMGGAVITAFVGYRLVLKRSKPLAAAAF